MNGRFARSGRSFRTALIHPRKILLGVIVATGVALCAQWVAPWVLPARIYEGPLVQQAAEDGAMVVWFTTRPAQCELIVQDADGERRFEAESDGKHHRARVSGLAAGRTYAYRIRGENRELAADSLQTNKPPDQPFRFLVFGDSGKATRVQYQLARRMVEASPDFVLHTGDLIYSAGERRRFADRFFVPYRDLISRVGFWPTLGNHDISEPGRGEPYLDVFELPENGPAGMPAEHNYWFDYGPTRIAVIDSNHSPTDLRDRVAPWLIETMTDNDVRWRFVVLHHPIVSVGPHGAGDEVKAVRAALMPAIESARVDIVFSGHDHLYQRTDPMIGGEAVESGQWGVVYVITGSGGAKLYAATMAGGRPEWLAAYDDQQHSFTQISIEADALKLEQISVTGEQLDAYELRKPAAVTRAAEAGASGPP